MQLLEKHQKMLTLVSDAAMVTASFYLAFLIRYEARIPASHMGIFFQYALVLASIRLVFFSYFGLYRGIWRYAAVNDFINIAKAVLSGSAVFTLVVVFTHNLMGFPRSVFIIDALLTLFFIGGIRFSLRLYRETVRRKKIGRAPQKKILIIGAGDAGYTILREIKGNPRLNYAVAGFIDDNELKQRMNIGGVPVLGTRADITRLVRSLKIEKIIIAIPSLGREALKPIVRQCEEAKVKLRIVPAIGDLINGHVSFSQIREVRIEDLLGREQVSIDIDSVRSYIAGKRVLVTGAGGSIGREICRQVIKFNPASLILLGRGENSIFEAYNELVMHKGDGELVQVIGDIINRKKMEGVFRNYAPHIVFHAGADKHVPLLELNPDEAVLNNVVGTKNVIEVAEETGVAKVVCVSTDKAANPVSVMGCAKRIAEMIIQSRQGGHAAVTSVIGVRFGNVLGSRGSVIPLFRRQIRQGGPVTVTHPDMMRYFMTIPEAAQLVLQAGAIGKCGDIFLLDMGNPVKIADLARQMIQLSGLEPDKDISVKFVGMRPGERLVESLTGEGEILSRTEHPKIFRLLLKGKTDEIRGEDLEKLRTLAIDMDHAGIVRQLKTMVTNFKPQGCWEAESGELQPEREAKEPVLVPVHG